MIWIIPNESKWPLDHSGSIWYHLEIRAFRGPLFKMSTIYIGKSEIASVFAQKSSISTEEDTMTHYHLPQLYEKLMSIDGTPIELNIFNLPGAHDPRAVECRQNIYPQSVSHTLLCLKYLIRKAIWYVLNYEFPNIT